MTRSRQMLERRLKILAQRENVATYTAQILHRGAHSLRVAQAQHQAGLREERAAALRFLRDAARRANDHTSRANTDLA
jgi:hypothetical protein